LTVDSFVFVNFSVNVIIALGIAMDRRRDERRTRSYPIYSDLNVVKSEWQVHFAGSID